MSKYILKEMSCVLLMNTYRLGDAKQWENLSGF
jgi:hypothetical protein